MKVYECPAEIPEIEVDYKNYDREKEEAKEDAHRAQLKAWLKANGYPGKRTGETVRFGVADGYAQYMLAEGKRSVLIHLPYGDAYSYRDVGFLPKAEILKRIEQDKRIRAIFSKKE